LITPLGPNVVGWAAQPGNWHCSLLASGEAPQPCRSVAALFAELYTANKPEAADRLLASHFINHEEAAERSPGPRGAKETAAWLHATFSDLRFDIEDVISDGASVVVRLTMSGRHTGAAGPFADMPVTGRSFRSRQIHIWRVSDGKVTDHWAVRDDLGWMTQLGLLSALNESGQQNRAPT
jgi:predicted ester cyclase